MPFYTQPSSAGGNQLGTRCYAYSTLNALSQNGIAVPGITTQAQADTWIGTLPAGMGGGPGQVLRALQLPQVPVQYTNHFYNRVGYAVANNLPVVLATTATPPGGNHWIYVTGVNAATFEIIAEDQQNPGRGPLLFSAAGGYTAQAGGVTYTLNNASIFITIAIQRTALDAL